MRLVVDIVSVFVSLDEAGENGGGKWNRNVTGSFRSNSTFSRAALMQSPLDALRVSTIAHARSLRLSPSSEALQSATLADQADVYVMREIERRIFALLTSLAQGRPALTLDVPPFLTQNHTRYDSVARRVVVAQASAAAERAQQGEDLGPDTLELARRPRQFVSAVRIMGTIQELCVSQRHMTKRDLYVDVTGVLFSLPRVTMARSIVFSRHCSQRVQHQPHRQILHRHTAVCNPHAQRCTYRMCCGYARRASAVSAPACQRAWRPRRRRPAVCGARGRHQCDARSRCAPLWSAGEGSQVSMLHVFF